MSPTGVKDPAGSPALALLPHAVDKMGPRVWSTAMTSLMPAGIGIPRPGQLPLVFSRRVSGCFRRQVPKLQLDAAYTHEAQTV